MRCEIIFEIWLYDLIICIFMLVFYKYSKNVKFNI